MIASTIISRIRLSRAGQCGSRRGSLIACAVNTPNTKAISGGTWLSACRHSPAVADTPSRMILPVMALAKTLPWATYVKASRNPPDRLSRQATVSAAWGGWRGVSVVIVKPY